MKKLIIREVISVILVIGVFLSVFTLPNGWDKAGKGRYEIAIVAAFWAAVVAFFYFIATCAADDTKKSPKNNAPKKVILFSLWVTALAIILPIVLIIIG